MVFIETIVLFVIVSFLLHKWFARNFHVFAERGIIHEKPKPFLGNMELRALLGKVSSLRIAIDKYLENKANKIYGSYAFSEPLLMVTDLELIKKIGIKDFEHFVNHYSISLGNQDKVFNRNLSALKDQQWKEMRNTLTPTFTGSKMRSMHELIKDCSMEYTEYINNEMNNSFNHEIELEMNDFFTRFANDVIATVAFGIRVNSLKDKKNKFYKTGSLMTQNRLWPVLKSFLLFLFPKVMKALRLSLSDSEMMKYFRDLVFDAIKYRQEYKITRPDMIQLLLEARRHFEESKAVKSNPEGRHATFDDDDLFAQCFIFFIAGFDTVSMCLCFTLYELAMNPEIQERLYEEIMNVDAQLNGTEFNYDTLTKMSYLNMILSESLRKWPPVSFTDRIANDDLKLNDEEGNLIVEIRKGDRVLIPILGIHHDPEYFPEPEKFDPLRFSKENEIFIKPNSFLPFGIGPRNCIGNRLALMEAKSILYNLIKNFQFGPTEKTPLDMMDAIRGYQRMPNDKFPMKVRPRMSKAQLQ